MQMTFQPALSMVLPQRIPRVTAVPPSAAETEDLEVFLGDRDFVMSFARGVSVIQAFANAERPLAIVEISECINVPRATVRRLLHTLCELGFVRQTGQRFELMPKTLELGNAFMSSNPMLAGMQPLVTRLSDRLHAFCALMVPEGDQTLMVNMAGASDGSSAGIHLSPAVGRKVPLYSSASGQLFLSTFSEAQFDAYIARAALLPLTARTQTVPAQLRSAVSRVRLLGYAVCDRTFSNLLRSVAVPVRDRRGTLVAAIVAVIPAERLTEDWLRSGLLPELQAAAQDASDRWR